MPDRLLEECVAAVLVDGPLLEGLAHVELGELQMLDKLLVLGTELLDQFDAALFLTPKYADLVIASARLREKGLDCLPLQHVQPLVQSQGDSARVKAERLREVWVLTLNRCQEHAVRTDKILVVRPISTANLADSGLVQPFTENIAWLHIVRLQPHGHLIVRNFLPCKALSQLSNNTLLVIVVSSVLCDQIFQ